MSSYLVVKDKDDKELGSFQGTIRDYWREELCDRWDNGRVTLSQLLDIRHSIESRLRFVIYSMRDNKDNFASQDLSIKELFENLAAVNYVAGLMIAVGTYEVTLTIE